MSWIVLGEDKGKIKLVSKSDSEGILPKGAYLTVEHNNSKYILRVDNSAQYEPYSPSPNIIDMDLSSLTQDLKCKNIVTAYRVKDLSTREDGLIDYIRPQSIARRSNQEEINQAMGIDQNGPKVFLATVHSNQNQILIDDTKKRISVTLPEDMFYHQMLICGATGSGKTVAMKYLAQYFVEELQGAVLAINVKDVDFLKMDKPSKTNNKTIKNEWDDMNLDPHGIENFIIYYPANTEISSTQKVSEDRTYKITLDVNKIDPESLIGLLQGITDVATQNLPNIFRYWQKEVSENDKNFSDFIRYFSNGMNNSYTYNTMNGRGEISEIKLHTGTYNNIQRNLDFAADFFDNPGAKFLTYEDILVYGKMSVINVAGDKGREFGSIALRQLLHDIVEAKSLKKSKVPILIIIDEVHQFYNHSSSKETLGALDTICRTGRSQKIGVIFSSQNPADMPSGLSSVINTKLFFKSDPRIAKSYGLTISSDEMESLRKGFAAANIHELSQAKIVKFPLSCSGVFEVE